MASELRDNDTHPKELLVSLRQLRKRPISVLSSSFTCASALYILVVLSVSGGGAHALEIKACAALIALFSVVSLLTESISVFLAFHGARAFISVVILLISGGGNAVLELLLLLPFILETALYVKPLQSIAVSLGFLGCVAALDVRSLRPQGLSAVTEHCVPVALASCAFLTAGALLTVYR